MKKTTAAAAKIKILPFGPLDRFAIFGGSFDPIHQAHVEMAKAIRDEMGLDVIILPAAQQPLKKTVGATAAQRLEMCRIAIWSEKGIQVNNMEVDRGGTSYTIDTLRTLREAYPQPIEIFFLVGEDSLDTLPRWKEVREIGKLATLCVAERDQRRERNSFSWSEAEDMLGHRPIRVSWQAMDVSSTDVRAMLERGEDATEYLPIGVMEYIRKNQLYGWRPVLGLGEKT